MVEPDEDFSYAETRDRFEAKLSRDLAQTFDTVAKIAMRASAEFSEGASNMKVLQKIQKAHSVVTLIMDDAMRGLNEATSSALAFGVMTGLEAGEDKGES
ncbi:MAG TPA: hypothetical protein VNU44_21950 [Bryobacteraceae bacterium]|jgi:hypothetical protein|nr:hypothetical protein [Bryobacteraceae bacterium]